MITPFVGEINLCIFTWYNRKYQCTGL